MSCVCGEAGCVCVQFEEKHHSSLLQLVADQLKCSVTDIVDFELNVCDTQDGVIGGSLSARQLLLWPPTAYLVHTSKLFASQLLHAPLQPC